MGRMLCEDGSYLTINRAAPRGWREAWDRPSLGIFRGTWPCHHLHPSFQPPTRETRSFCCCQSPVLWRFIGTAPGNDYLRPGAGAGDEQSLAAESQREDCQARGSLGTRLLKPAAGPLPLCPSNCFEPSRRMDRRKLSRVRGDHLLSLSL